MSEPQRDIIDNVIGAAIVVIILVLGVLVGVTCNLLLF